MKKISPVSILFICLMLIAGCKEKPPYEDDLPMTDIAYGSHVRQKMDIVLPITASRENPVPIALFIHGGSWSGGDKKDFDWMQQSVNDYRFAYVTINYRLVQDQVTYREMLKDVHSAIAYLKKHSEAYHLKTDKMCIMGSSAGGHLALLYSYSQSSPIPIAFVSSQVGPTDFCDPGQMELNGREKLPLMNKLLGTQITADQIDDPNFTFPQSWYSASPIYHVTENSTPTVLAYGVKDELVAYSNATRLNDKLEEKGVPHRLITFPNSGHGLNQDPASSTQYWQTLVYYLDTYF